jgi:hypothetical protein
VTRQIVWFSAGAPSAVLAKLCPDAELVYCDPGSEHPDNARFIADVARWCGRSVTVLKSKQYRDTWDVWEKRGYILSHHGAPCTVELKKKLRYSYQQPDDVQMLGYHVGEEGRAARTRETEPGIEWAFPLIDRGLTKSDCLAIIDRAGIALPEMYQMGYPHNNCVGCPKGGMGYWNAVRVDFPETFTRMAELERRYDFATHRDDAGPVFLDELDPTRGDMRAEGTIECSVLCAITEFDL